ncbi:hypothetical protein BsWGS_09570 [Bradybaena similaris]
MTVIRVPAMSVLVLALMVIIMESSTSARSVADVSSAGLLKIVERSVEGHRFKRGKEADCNDLAKGGRMKSPACNGYGGAWFQ